MERRCPLGHHPVQDRRLGPPDPLRTQAINPDHHDVLKKYFARKGTNRLSLAALETLAIVAYRQPVTAPEISDIRGVNSNQAIRTLLERRMIRVADSSG